MTDQQPAPYTDDDLRAQAARQHAALTEEPDFTAVGEGMEDSLVASTETDGGGKTWAELLPYEADGGKAYNEAQRAIHELIPGADVSEWAVNLGADGLEPDEHTLTWSAGVTPIVRLHMAFHPRMSPEARTELATQLAEVCGRILADAAGPRPTDQP